MHSEIDQVEAVVDTLRTDWSVPIGVYPNSGVFAPPDWVFGAVTPSKLATCAARWLGHGVQLVGGCCGTRPAHIRALREWLSEVNC